MENLTIEYSYSDVICLFLEPVLTDIGELWIRDKITLAQGYVAGKNAEDFHAFGRKMVTTFLKIAGWQVHDMGNDITV